MENKRRWHSLSSVYIEHKFRQIESEHLLSDSVGLLKLKMMSKCKGEDLAQRTMTKRGPRGPPSIDERKREEEALCVACCRQITNGKGSINHATSHQLGKKSPVEKKRLWAGRKWKHESTHQSCEWANFSVSGSQESMSGGLVERPAHEALYIALFGDIMLGVWGVKLFFYRAWTSPPFSTLCSGFLSCHPLDLKHLSGRDLCCTTFDGWLYQPILPNVVQTVPREGPPFWLALNDPLLHFEQRLGYTVQHANIMFSWSYSALWELVELGGQLAIAWLACDSYSSHHFLQFGVEPTSAL